jgi:hypothetical protein
MVLKIHDTLCTDFDKMTGRKEKHVDVRHIKNDTFFIIFVIPLLNRNGKHLYAIQL